MGEQISQGKFERLPRKKKTCNLISNGLILVVEVTHTKFEPRASALN